MAKKKPVAEEKPRFKDYNHMAQWATWTIIKHLINGALQDGVHVVLQTVRRPNTLPGG